LPLTGTSNYQPVNIAVEKKDKMKKIQTVETILQINTKGNFQEILKR